MYFKVRIVAAFGLEFRDVVGSFSTRISKFRYRKLLPNRMPRISSGSANMPAATRTSIQEAELQSSSLADSRAGNEIRRAHSSLGGLPKNRESTGNAEKLVDREFEPATMAKKAPGAANAKLIEKFVNGELDLIDVNRKNHIID